MLEGFNSDLVLRIVDYLNITESGRLAVSTKRYYYLVHQYRSIVKGPELVMAASWDSTTQQQLTSQQVLTQAKKKLQSSPNFVLIYETEQSAMANYIGGPTTPAGRSCFPPNTIVLGSVSSDIQVNHPHRHHHHHHHHTTTTFSATTTSSSSCGATIMDDSDELNQVHVEHKSNSSIMCCSFPNAMLEPFAIDALLSQRTMDENLQQLVSKLLQQGTDCWKAIIIYAVGDGTEYCETVITTLQKALPHLAIVGGITGMGYITTPPPPPPAPRTELSTMSIRQLRLLHGQLGGHTTSIRNILEKSELIDAVVEQQQQQQQQQGNNDLLHFDDAVFGVVLGGDVPIRSMVSRGVTSYCNDGGIPQPTSPLVVHSSAIMNTRTQQQQQDEDDDDDDNEGDSARRIHMIQEIRNTETDKVYSAVEMMLQIQPKHPQFIGIRHTDGFELHGIMNPRSLGALGPPAFIVYDDDKDTLLGSQIDFFSLTGQACMDDMDRTAFKLRQQTNGEQILGAVMVSCSGRGPQPGGLLRERMSDATRFSKVFPEVPCLGFYAGGEIGPSAMAGKDDVFHTGRAALQGFTVVFALFIVPVIDHRIQYHLDDGPNNVTQFVQSRLGV